MDSRKFSIGTLLAGTGVLFLGYALLVTLLPIRAQMEGFSTALIGAMGGIYFAGFGLGCLVGPVAVKWVGHIRAFAGFAAMAAALVLVHPLAVDGLLWVVLRGLTGLCMAVLFMVIESWLNDQSSNEVRGRVLSLYIIITNLVTMVGQLSVNLFDPAGAPLFILAAMMVCLSLVPLSLTPAASPRPIAQTRIRIARLYRHSPTGVIGCLLIGLADGAFWSLGPVYAQGQGLSIASVTVVMALFVVGGTISQWPLGRYSDKVDRRWVLAFVCAGSVCTALGLALLPLREGLQAYLLACAHGAFMIPIYPLLLAHANDHAPTEELVETSSGLLLLYAVGAAVGPLAVAPAMEAYGVGALFLFIAAVLALMCLYVLYRLTRRPMARDDERVEFYPVCKTTPSLYELECDD